MKNKAYTKCKLFSKAEQVGRNGVAVTLCDLEEKRYLLVPILPHLIPQYYTLFDKNSTLSLPSSGDLLLKEYKRPERKAVRLVIEGPDYLHAKIVFSNNEYVEMQPEEAIYIAVKGKLEIEVENSLLLTKKEALPQKDSVLIGQMEKLLKKMPDDIIMISKQCCGWKIE